MKKAFFLISFLLLAKEKSFAQSITIVPNPANGSMVNVQNKMNQGFPPSGGTNHVITIPVVTALPAVAQSGMMVFYANTGKLLYHNGTSWVELDKSWVANGNNISNPNVGNVGIGVPSPTTKLDVDGVIRAKGLFMPIKNITPGVDYTMQDGDYTLVVDGNGGCSQMYITLSNPAQNTGRIINISMSNFYALCSNHIYFKDYLGNNFGWYLSNAGDSVLRTNITFQCSGSSWVVIGDNFSRNN